MLSAISLTTNLGFQGHYLKRLDIISKMRYLLPRLCIEKLYKSFVGSLLDYSDVIYDNCSNIDSTKIENILKR
jgi:hypothetical protein